MQQAAGMGSRRAAGVQSDGEMLRFGTELPRQTDRHGLDMLVPAVILVMPLLWVCMHSLSLWHGTHAGLHALVSPDARWVPRPSQ